MIPKTIHYVWLGQGKKGELIDNCIASWKIHMPHYTINEWNEDSAALNSPYLKRALLNKQWAFASDYVRCHCLYHMGGIYLDTDTEVIKPFDNLLDDTGFLAFEDEKMEHPVNQIMGFVPGHPFLKMMMDFYNTELAGYNGYIQAPRITKIILKEYMNQQECTKQPGVTVYPCSYFYPYNPFDQSRPLKQLMWRDVTHDTYAIHHWAFSWKVKSSLRKRLMNKISRLVRSKKEKKWFNE